MTKKSRRERFENNKLQKNLRKEMLKDRKVIDVLTSFLTDSKTEKNWMYERSLLDKDLIILFTVPLV
jgi:hypothetical protein